MYRPDGFDNPHIWVDEDKFDVYGDHYDAFEAGADEYERCLKKIELIELRDFLNKVPPIVGSLYSLRYQKKKGYLVFILEEK